MKPQNLLIFSCTALCLLFSQYALAQSYSKTYKESYSLKPDAVIKLDVHQTELEVRTWNKNEVLVEGSIEVEGIPEQHKETFFNRHGFTILGNSEQVEIKNSMPLKRNRIMGFPAQRMPNRNSVKKAEVRFKIDSTHIVFTDTIDYIKIDTLRLELKKMRQKMASTRDTLRLLRNEFLKNRSEMIQNLKELIIEADSININSKFTENDSTYIFTSNGIMRLNRKFQRKDKPNKITRKLILYIPKNAKLEMNLRHSQLKLAEKIHNLKATVVYSPMLAEHISGENTDILVRFSPVQINRWELGQLKLNFAESCTIKYAENLSLTANNSPVHIDNLSGKADIKLHFSDFTASAKDKHLEKLNIDASFSTLTLESLDALDEIYLAEENSKVNVSKKSQSKIKKSTADNDRGSHKITLKNSQLKEQ